ncbi:JmjC domain-containing protein [Nocardia sp. R7R-8]|uniref:JmjC domain-containing protein n=1 Tax=Nocardia sp. R7R-8 TaxID=3459304 RepID=UPI00403E25D0
MNDADSSSVLQQLVKEPDLFLTQVWGQRSAHFPSMLTQPLIGITDIDALFATSLLRVQHFRLVREGRAIPPSEYIRTPGPPRPPELVAEASALFQQFTEGTPDTTRIVAAINSGATLILQGAHRFLPALRAFCDNLTEELGHVCQANIYITPPGEQGLPPHTDPHNAFVVQAFGSKQWTLRDGDGPDTELTMNPGDTLYLTKNTVHSARSTTGQLSGHITIGVRATACQALVNSYVTQTLENLLDQGEARNLPVGWPVAPHRAHEQLTHILEHLAHALVAADTGHILDDHLETLRHRADHTTAVLGSLHSHTSRGRNHDGDMV